jgi:hypothetical protein
MRNIRSLSQKQPSLTQSQGFGSLIKKQSSNINKDFPHLIENNSGITFAKLQ